MFKKMLSLAIVFAILLNTFSAVSVKLLHADTETEGDDTVSNDDFDFSIFEKQIEDSMKEEEKETEDLINNAQVEYTGVSVEKEVYTPTDPPQETEEHEEEEPQTYYYSVIEYDCSGNIVKREDNISSSTPREDEEIRPAAEACRVDPPKTSTSQQEKPEEKPEQKVEQKVEKVEEPVQQQYNHTPDIWVYVCLGLFILVVVLFSKNVLSNRRRNKSVN